MSEEKDLINLIKNRVENGDSREKIISDLILEGYSYREIEAVLEKMRRENKLPDDFWLNGKKQKERAAFFRTKFKKIEEEIGEDKDYEEEGFSYFWHRYKKWFFIFLGLTLTAVICFFVWYFFYWQSPLFILERSFRNLSEINSFWFQSKITAKVENFDFNDDKYLNALLKNVDFNQPLKVNLTGSVNLIAKDYLKRSFVASIFKDENLEIWKAGVIQIYPNGFYLNTNYYLNAAGNEIEPLSQSYWIDLGKTTSPKSINSFIFQNFFLGNLNFYSLNSSNLLLLRDSLKNFSFSKENFLLIKKLSSPNSDFYRLLIIPHQELTKSILNLLKPIITTGRWLKESDFSEISWEVWIGKEDLLPYQINLFFKDENNPFVELTLKGFNYPFDIVSPSLLLLPEEVIEIIQTNANN